MIDIKFKNTEVFNIELEKNSVTEKFKTILERNLNKSLPLFRDPGKYDEKYLRKLCGEVKEKLNWDWLSDDYSIENTVRFHKGIEKLIDKQGDFTKLDGEIQNLIHEAHFCIHSLQYKNENYKHGFMIQLEWFNDDFEILPDEAEFDTEINFGDVILQNAYVGHPPIQCYQQNDHAQIERTCAFPDRIKPGIKINLMQTKPNAFDWKHYEDWWRKNCSAFVDRVGWQTIKRYTGFTKIGKVTDLELFRKILEKEILEVESVVLK